MRTTRRQKMEFLAERASESAAGVILGIGVLVFFWPRKNVFKTVNKQTQKQENKVESEVEVEDEVKDETIDEAKDELTPLKTTWSNGSVASAQSLVRWDSKLSRGGNTLWNRLGTFAPNGEAYSVEPLGSFKVLKASVMAMGSWKQRDLALVGPLLIVFKAGVQEAQALDLHEAVVSVHEGPHRALHALDLEVQMWTKQARVKHKKRTFVLACSSQEDMQTWLDLLRTKIVAAADLPCVDREQLTPYLASHSQSSPALSRLFTSKGSAESELADTARSGDLSDSIITLASTKTIASKWKRKAHKHQNMTRLQKLRSRSLGLAKQLKPVVIYTRGVAAVIFCLHAGYQRRSISWVLSASGLWLWSNKLLCQPRVADDCAMVYMTGVGLHCLGSLGLPGVVIGALAACPLLLKEKSTQAATRFRHQSEELKLVRDILTRLPLGTTVDSAKLPDWLRQPDSLPSQTLWKYDWLNAILNNMWKHALRGAIEKTMIDVLNPIIQNVLPSFLKSAVITKFCLGNTAPHILSMTVDREVTTAVVLDIALRGLLDADVLLEVRTSGPSGFVRVYNLSLEGTLRLELNPLVEQWPAFSAMSYSFKDMPQVSFEIEAFGLEVMHTPLLSSWLIALVRNLLATFFVLPAKVTAPDFREEHAQEQAECEGIPIGVVFVQPVCASGVGSDIERLGVSLGMTSLRLYTECTLPGCRGQTHRTKLSQGLECRFPGEKPFAFLVDNPVMQSVELVLMEKHTIQKDVEVGRVSIRIMELEEGGKYYKKQVVALDTDGVELHVNLDWAPFSALHFPPDTPAVSRTIKQIFPPPEEDTIYDDAEDTNKIQQSLTETTAVELDSVPPHVRPVGMVFLRLRRMVTYSPIASLVYATISLQGVDEEKTTRPVPVRKKLQIVESDFVNEIVHFPIQDFAQNSVLTIKVMLENASVHGVVKARIADFFAEALRRNNTQSALPWEFKLRPEGILHATVHWRSFSSM